MLRIPLALILSFALGLLLQAEPVHRGFNFGDMLEETTEGKWSGLKLKPDYLKTIHDAGFDTIRVPIDWVDHAGPAPTYTIDPKFFARIDEVIDEAKSYNFTIILDYQVDNELYKDPDHHYDRFLTIWKQLAEHYQSEPDSVYFELLNEAHDQLTADKWNKLIVRALAVVRPTNPTRTVVVGAIQWNSFDKLPTLELPDSDQHLLVTFHYYNPMTFTHQGALWIGPFAKNWLGTKWNGTDAEKAVIVQDFTAAADWGKAHHRPIYLGEFGSFHLGDIDSRVRWTTCCRETAEKLGLRWTYWEFCSGFGAYDPKTNQWRKPLLDALIPPRNP